MSSICIAKNVVKSHHAWGWETMDRRVKLAHLGRWTLEDSNKAPGSFLKACDQETDAKIAQKSRARAKSEPKVAKSPLHK